MKDFTLIAFGFVCFIEGVLVGAGIAYHYYCKDKVK